MSSRHIHTARIQNLKAISLFLAMQWPKTQVRVMTSLFETQFLAFLIAVQENESHFLEF